MAGDSLIIAAAQVASLLAYIERLHHMTFMYQTCGSKTLGGFVKVDPDDIMLAFLRAQQLIDLEVDKTEPQE